MLPVGVGAPLPELRPATRGVATDQIYVIFNFEEVELHSWCHWGNNLKVESIGSKCELYVYWSWPYKIDVSF